MRRGEKVNVDLFCLFHFIILYSTNGMNKLKFNYFFILKTKNNGLTVQFFFNLQKSTPLSTQWQCWST